MLELKDALLEVEGKPLFQRLSLMARDGQMTCITGTSGVGKTLLARVMVGLHPLDEGYVSIDGELITPLSAPVFRKMTIYLPQPVEPSDIEFEPDTSDLETVFGGFANQRFRNQNTESACRHSETVVSNPAFDLRPPVKRNISLVIADDPDVSQIEYLKSQAIQGRTVIVMSQRQEYIKTADQLITLEAI